MTGFTFQRATQQQAKLRLALIGPAGSGKTYSALAIASHLGARVALIDTEHGSASKYASLFTFDTLALDTFGPLTYVAAIQAAEAAGYDVLVIDSLSHAWAGKGGALELKDEATRRSRSNDSFAAWREITPQHNALVEAMLACRCHLIGTMRTKTEYVIEPGEGGKNRVRKVGLAPVQRDGLEYEFDVVGDLDQDNTLVVSKTRCPALNAAVIAKPGQQVAETLRGWLGQGEPAPEKPAPAPAPTVAVTPSRGSATARNAGNCPDCGSQPCRCGATAPPAQAAANGHSDDGGPSFVEELSADLDAAQPPAPKPAPWKEPTPAAQAAFLNDCARLGLSLQDIRTALGMPITHYLKRHQTDLGALYEQLQARLAAGELQAGALAAPAPEVE